MRIQLGLENPSDLGVKDFVSLHTASPYLTFALVKDDLGELNESFARALTAENKSPRTIDIYTSGVKQFISFSEATHRPTEASEVTREGVEAYILSVLATRKPATGASAYRSLKRFFNWLIDEGEIESHPMAKMKLPHVPEPPVPVLSDEQVRKLLKVCAGSNFPARRDSAILFLFYDSWSGFSRPQREQVLGMSRLSPAQKMATAPKGAVADTPRMGRPSKVATHQSIQRADFRAAAPTGGA